MGSEEIKEEKVMKPIEVIDEFRKDRIEKSKMDCLSMRGLTADVASDVYGKLSDPKFYDDVVFFIKTKNIIKELGLDDDSKGFKDIEELYRTLDEYCEKIALLDPDETYKEDVPLSKKKAGNIWLYFILIGAYVHLNQGRRMSDGEFEQYELECSAIAEKAKQNKGGTLPQIL